MLILSLIGFISSIVGMILYWGQSWMIFFIIGTALNLYYVIENIEEESGN